jgi:hypothetical protein
MKSPPEPDLQLRGKLIRSLGALREMLPGSFVERQRACGQLPVLAPRKKLLTFWHRKPLGEALSNTWRVCCDAETRLSTGDAALCYLHHRKSFEEREP